MRFGNWEVRPLGGGPGCLMMIAISIGLTIVLNVILNVLFR